MAGLLEPDKYFKAYQYPTVDACIDFINRFVFTYDPRQKYKKIPFFLYPRQEEFIQWLWDLYMKRQNGVCDKARDVGASWGFIAFSVWLMLFQVNTSIGIFSFKADSVDKIGDISTLFGKIRFILDNLPALFIEGIKSNYFYIRNSTTNSDISGASGDNPGRGDRRSIYFKDESAFYERAEVIEAALSETSDCIIDISTHQGTNTLFYQKVSSGAIPVFIFEWFSNPNHTQEMYNVKRQAALDQGLIHIFQREIDRNPGASIENVVVPTEWVRSALQDKIIITGKRISALDVADGGVDTNAQCIMDGNQLISITEWGDTQDVTATSERAFWTAVDNDCVEFRYDNIGVGADVRGAVRKIKEAIEAIPEAERTDRQKKALDMKIVGWSAAGKVIDPIESDTGDKRNDELFENAKSQAYWRVRFQFFNTWRYANGKDCDQSQVISFAKLAGQAIINKFMNEISQPQKDTSASGKIIINKKPKGTKSPNMMEALIIARAKIEEFTYQSDVF
jgi:hypothetical protein